MENKLILMVNRLVKRCIDIVGSLIGLLVLTIVFVPIAIAIKLDSPGSIFFTQTRYGKQGQPFQIRKFRSMVANAEELKSEVPQEAQGTNRQDSQVTRVGRFLRRTALDELPQFWNVLVGEMSLVGTRPPTSDELVYYGEEPLQQVTVKPGITSESLVVGCYPVKDWEQIVALDQRYQSRWNPLSDFVIFGKAIAIILARIVFGESLGNQNSAKKKGM
jgi:lipopolysaccharide/colanic/teichoic acid biosynthesis glycosyltransferase